MKKLCHSLALISLCSQVYATEKDVVYGDDNRVDTFESSSPFFRTLAEGTAARIAKTDVSFKGESVQLLSQPLKEISPKGVMLPVCEKERFSHQPVVADCSGFLVGEDLLVTAGHCMTGMSTCEAYHWVFDYKVADAEQTEVSVARENVYNCKEIIASGYNLTSDFALFRLDRPVPREPLRVAQSKPEIGTPLVMIGHPTGLPQKITDGAKLLSYTQNAFYADLDAFAGNSGAAVFNADSGEIVGILVEGERDYVDNFKEGCSEVNYLPHSRGQEKISSFEQFLPYL